MESGTAFPFRKLTSDIYLILDVMMYVKHQDVKEFMFALNKGARNFIQNNFIAVRNGFTNEGLVDFLFIGNRR